MRHIRKSSTLDAQIIHLLMDGKVHTQTSISRKFEINRKTVYNAVERLRAVFIIHTFHGGANHGGIYLDPQHIYYALKKQDNQEQYFTHTKDEDT